MNDVIVKEHEFNQSIDKVWSAISNESEISEWFIKADFKAEKGYAYTFTASEEKGCLTITGEVKEASPYTLVYTWVVADTNVETTVKWVLKKTENGTNLYLEHSGISNYPDDSAVAMFNSFSGGWADCVNQLEKYVNQEVHAG